MAVHPSDLYTQLCSCVEGLLYFSEAEYPIVPEKLKQTNLEDARKFLLSRCPYGGSMEEASVAGFFTKMHTQFALSDREVAKKLAQRYDSLYQFLKNNFTTVTLFRCGRVTVKLFFLLESKDAIWVLHTTAIET